MWLGWWRWSVIRILNGFFGRSYYILCRKFVCFVFYISKGKILFDFVFLVFFILLKSRFMNFLVNVVRLNVLLWVLIVLLKFFVVFVLLSIIFIKMFLIVWSMLVVWSLMSVLFVWIWILVLRRVGSMVVVRVVDKWEMSIVRILMRDVEDWEGWCRLRGRWRDWGIMMRREGIWGEVGME